VSRTGECSVHAMGNLINIEENIACLGDMRMRALSGVHTR